MPDIDITKSRGKKYIGGASPIVPAYVDGETPPPNNPPGSTVTLYKQLGDVTDKSFLGKNGFVPVVVDEGLLTLQPLPQIQENGLVSGGIVQWTGIGYVFNVSSSFYRIGGNPYLTDPTQKTLSTPDATNDRIDVFAVDVNNAVVIIEGTPAPSPVKPQIDPLTQLELTSVIVTAASTEPTLTEEVIYDENIEWTGSSTGTGTVVFNSAVDPFQGSLSIEATNIENGLKVRLTNSIDVDITTFQTIGFQIKLKEGLFAGQEIGLTFLNSSGDAVSNKTILNIDKSDLAYQFIGIALSTFSFIDNDIRAIEFDFIRTKGQTVNDGFFLDIIKLEGGINPPISINSFLGLSDTPSTYLGQGGKTVAVKSDESGLEFVAGGGGASTFLALTDTPSTYSGQAGLFPRVNVGETALEFDSVSPYDLDQEGASDGDVLTWVAANSRYEPVTPSGGSGLWTDATTFIYRNGPVVVGNNAQLSTSSTFEVVSQSALLGNKFFTVWKSDKTTKLMDFDSSGIVDFTSGLVRFGSPVTPTAQGVTIRNTVNSNVNFFRLEAFDGTTIFDVPNSGSFNWDSTIIRTGNPTDVTTTGPTFKGGRTDNFVIFRVLNSAETRLFEIQGNGVVIVNGFNFRVGGGTAISNGTSLKGSATGTNPIFRLENGSGNPAIQVRGNRQVLMEGLPTSDPGVTGSLWNDAGTLKIS